MPLRYKCFLALLVVLTGCQSTQNLLGRRALTSNERSGNAEESPPKTETAGLPQPTDADPPQTSSPALSTAEDHLRLGEKALEQNRYAQAQEHFEQALRQDPALARAHHRLAVVADKLEQFDEAERHYLAALEVDSRNASVLSDLGFSYWLQKRYPESERFLKQALRVDPDFQKAIANLGLVYGTIGRRDEALALLKQVGTEEQALSMLEQLAAMPDKGGNPVAQQAPNRAAALPDINPRAGDATLKNLTRELFDREAGSPQIAANGRDSQSSPFDEAAPSRSRLPSSSEAGVPAGRLPEIVADASAGGVSPFDTQNGATPPSERRFTDDAQSPRSTAVADAAADLPRNLPTDRSSPFVTNDQGSKQSLLWEQQGRETDTAQVASAHPLHATPASSSLAEVTPERSAMAQASAANPNVWPPRNVAPPSAAQPSEATHILQAGGVDHADERLAVRQHPLDSAQGQPHRFAHHEEAAGTPAGIEQTRGSVSPHSMPPVAMNSSDALGQHASCNLQQTKGLNAFTQARQQAALLGLGAGTAYLSPSLTRSEASRPAADPGATGNPAHSPWPSRGELVTPDADRRAEHRMEINPQQSTTLAEEAFGKTGRTDSGAPFAMEGISSPVDREFPARPPSEDLYSDASLTPAGRSAELPPQTAASRESFRRPGIPTDTAAAATEFDARSSQRVGIIQPEPYPYRPQSGSSDLPPRQSQAAAPWGVEQQPTIVPRGR